MLISLICLRILTYMMLNSRTGSMAYMAVLIIEDILPYLVVLGSVIFSFTVIFFGLFYDKSDRFVSLQISFRTVFDFTIGNVLFTIYEEWELLGMYITIIYAIISTIALLNILIAVLSAKFDEVN
mmetsp:Transcript_28727/g.5199  ORF Transcript_28727/g.5199 Transcript_28727/m.5199 type:complete len:125 (+) Transcript_28727:1050-1424(+)